MHRYSAFCMDIQSEIKLSLPRWSEDSSPAAPLCRVDVTRGRVETKTGLEHTLGKIRYGSADGFTQIEVPWAGRYLIGPQNTVTVDPEPGAAEEMTAIYISAFILMFIINANGALTLHGSAVSSGGSALIICGTQGAGKSTTAASLARRGYPVLCDDVIPVTEGPMVLPGIPLPKLLPDAYQRLVGDPSEAPHLFDGIDKYQVNFGCAKNPLPLKSIYVIEPSVDGELSISPVGGMEKIRLIISNLNTPGGIISAAGQFQNVTQRLGRTDLFRITRPLGPDTLEAVTETIIKNDNKK